MFNITSGISAGPVWNQQQVGQTQQAMRQPPSHMPMMPSRSSFAPSAQSAFGGQFGDLMSQGGNNMAINFGRQAAPINAQQNLNSQQARAQSGVSWANLLANQYGTDLASRSLGNNALLNLLRSFI